MSDLLIKGMEMPKEDEEIIIRISPNGTVMTEYALPITGVKAVPVPPHGDLIDRDALPTPRVEWEDIVNAPTIIQASEEGE